LGDVLVEEDLVDLAADCEIGFELPDARLGGGELKGLFGALAFDFASVDLLLGQRSWIVA
jgi:hypothetical protein